MLTIPDPGGRNQLAWAQAVARCLRDLDRRINSILPQRPRAIEESIRAKVELKPFELTVSSSTGEDPVPMIRVAASTLAGGSSTDLGFEPGDDPPYLLSPSAGVLQGGITIDTDGNVTSRWLEIVGSLSAGDASTYYVEIGTISQDPETDAWVVSNSRYGPIGVQICRNWYAYAEPFYGVSWI